MPRMRLGYVLVCIGVVVVLMACSSGQEPVEDNNTTFPGPPGSGGKEPTPTEVCEEQCIPAHAAGETDYRAVQTCLLCDACHAVCLAEGVPLECSAGSNGCSPFFTTCAECTASDCALVQQPDTSFFGICAGQATTCVANQECVSINNCVSSCVADSGT